MSKIKTSYFPTSSPVQYGNRKKARSLAGFLLLETMIGVVVFAMGAIALVRCVDSCLNAEYLKSMDQRARLVLENRMAEIQAGAVKVKINEEHEELTGMFKGITLKQSRTKLELKNEKEELLQGLWNIRVEAVWKAPGGSQSKALSFYGYQAS